MSRIAAAIAAVCIVASPVLAQDLKASLPILPPLVESKDKGILVDLVKAIGKEYTEGKIEIETFPFARAHANVESGEADFEMPLLMNPNAKESSLKFRYSSTKIFDVVFVLYANKNNPDINPQNLAKYKIDTDPGHVDFFDFKVYGNASIESGLQKVDLGRIDGWVFAMVESDAVLKRLGLKNIKRMKYRQFEVRMVLPKGSKGDQIDKVLSTAIAKLKTSGKYDEIMGPLLNQKFEEWR